MSIYNCTLSFPGKYLCTPSKGAAILGCCGIYNLYVSAVVTYLVLMLWALGPPSTRWRSAARYVVVLFCWLLYLTVAGCLVTDDFTALIPDTVHLFDWIWVAMLLSVPGCYFLRFLWQCRRRVVLGLRYSPYACCGSIPFVMDKNKMTSPLPVEVNKEGKALRFFLRRTGTHTFSSGGSCVGDLDPGVIVGFNLVRTVDLVRRDGENYYYQAGPPIKDARAQL